MLVRESWNGRTMKGTNKPASELREHHSAEWCSVGTRWVMLIEQQCWVVSSLSVRGVVCALLQTCSRRREEVKNGFGWRFGGAEWALLFVDFKTWKWIKVHVVTQAGFVGSWKWPESGWKLVATSNLVVNWVDVRPDRSAIRRRRKWKRVRL